MTDLTRFAQQLALWSREAIDHGRSPFRRVDLYPSLLTHCGEVRPPLVFWINRQSLQAGGVMVLPAGDETAPLDGLACARALGLTHAVAWTPQGACLWEETPTGPVCRQRFPGAAGLEDFRRVLESVLEALKLLAITGVRPPQELPAEYLVNLCRFTLTDHLEEQREAARLWLARKPTLALRTDADQLARRSGRAALLTLLALCWFDRLPSGLRPERIERPLRLAAQQLPAPLDRLSGAAIDLMPPPAHDFAVALTGLRHRLEQVQWRNDAERAATALALLLTPPPSRSPVEGTGLWLEPGDVTTDAATEASHWPDLLLARALWRQLRQQPPGMPYLGAPVELPQAAFAQTEITARFDDAGTPPTRDQQEPLAARLRLAWPHRRLPFPAGTPAWGFDLAALLGHAPASARLALDLPGDWLRQPGGAELLELLEEQATISAWHGTADGRCRLRLERCRRPSAETLLTTTAGASMTLPWEELRRWPAAALDLVPRLPAELLERLQDGRLGFFDPLPDSAGLELYLRSSLGRQLRALLPANAPLAALPLPSAEILRGLAADCAAVEADSAAIDRSLRAWLGWEHWPDLPQPPAARTAQPTGCGTAEAALEQLLETEGLPAFPEPYYYRLPVTDLHSFRLRPPLLRSGEFFGQVELTDAVGQQLQVDSPELARALELAARPDGEAVRLPGDPELLRQLLAAYRADLEQLYHRLETCAQAQCRDRRQARRLVERLWRREGLPPLTELAP